LNNVMAPNYPAAINSDSVIAVASSTKENGRSCFSNKGEIAAPGGNGDPNNNCNPLDTSELPGLCSLDKISECPYKIMGPVKESSSGFGAWAGTSFATDFIDAALGIILANPKVQGDQRLAVCMLEKGATPSPSDPDRNLGSGIVNIEGALAEETISTCKALYP
jgi:subtilisin family serine protease